MTISSISTQSSDWASQLLESIQGSGGKKDDDLASKLMNDLDQDGTSSLSLEESGLSESLFTAADADGDGQISAEELADALAQERSQMMAGSATSSASLLGTLLSQAGVSMPAAGQGQMPPPDEGEMADDIISQLDGDGDSALSLEESGLSEEVFNQIDADGDGVVSSQELADALKSEREEMMAAGGPGGAGGGGGTATASNAGTSELLESLLDAANQATQNSLATSAQLRQALQAYGSNLISTMLGEYDPTSGLSYQDYMSSGDMNLLNYIGTQSVDYTV